MKKIVEPEVAKILENMPFMTRTIQRVFFKIIFCFIRNEFFTFSFSLLSVQLAGIDNCIISRSGYTGEDGYEISIPKKHIQKFVEYWFHESHFPDTPQTQLHPPLSFFHFFPFILLLCCSAICAVPGVGWAGLGARDTLRLEAALSLYGHDLDDKTTLVEAGLTWALGCIWLPGNLPFNLCILFSTQQTSAGDKKEDSWVLTPSWSNWRMECRRSVLEWWSRELLLVVFVSFHIYNSF